MSAYLLTPRSSAALTSKLKTDTVTKLNLKVNNFHCTK